LRSIVPLAWFEETRSHWSDPLVTQDPHSSCTLALGRHSTLGLVNFA
jgi:hypothetical protein